MAISAPARKARGRVKKAVRLPIATVKVRGWQYGIYRADDGSITLRAKGGEWDLKTKLVFRLATGGGEMLLYDVGRETVLGSLARLNFDLIHTADNQWHVIERSPIYVPEESDE
jgi:hypothetical protein